MFQCPPPPSPPWGPYGTQDALPRVARPCSGFGDLCVDDMRPVPHPMLVLHLLLWIGARGPDLPTLCIAVT